MGKKNNVLAWYLNKPSVFADFCNGCLYEGEKTVLPEELAEVQKANDEVMRDRNGRLLKKGRERDVVKLLRKNHHFVMIAVENQDKINYCMPLRCMEYDVADFVKQLRRLKNRHKEEGGLETAEEYLSGMKETDRLIPIVTILFYHGKGKWNAAMRLKDMLDPIGMDQRLRRLATDYRMRVVNLEDLKEEYFETGLRELIGMMKRRESKEEMRKYYENNRERFCNMDEDTYDLLCTMLDLRSLSGKKKIYRDAEKETVDMCKAFDDLVKESEMRGEERGKRLGEKQGEKRGEKRGEEKLASLIEKLVQDGRMADILAVSQNAQKRKKMYQEYGI
ncbi:MAG: Rpn family recombination-promoting nuclease/putative transposase [Eubacteriales bacterium]|nr:Rpn family recombination-promoting nuclease/putative transposase [Eubacteriales bacterium]